jgi:hypothetical protein
VSFLKRRISAAVWELLLILVAAIVFATVYRLYFSRAVALTQVCQRMEAMQLNETADVFQQLQGEPAVALEDINRICEIRRPIKP